jgi:ppGpp synthetase/RelA/SpoT-type nucleotidyltranferase
VTESTLPMSKTALDRLGAHLAAGSEVSDEDLANLARAVDAYQQVLDGVKGQLTSLGYEATTRVKTTRTLVEKLRREHPMRLSQVQDLAGARIIVPNRPTQDDAAIKIRRHFEASGHACREIDRRTNPSHGYRALHLVLNVASVLVEIQIRTDLEDTWAQIVERLADQWGRGIRYGEQPVNPDTRVRAGEQTLSRRQAMAYLIELGTAIGEFELGRGALMLLGQIGDLFARLLPYASQLPPAQDPRPISELPAEERESADIVAAGLSLVSPPEVRGALAADPTTTTLGGLFAIFRTVFDASREETDTMLSELHDRERELRDTLQLIATAADDEE